MYRDSLPTLPSEPPSQEGWPWAPRHHLLRRPIPWPRRRWPRITVITPSYNQGEFLEATLRSVLAQGYPNLEYIVVDGGSSDGSVDVLRRYERHLAWWVSEADRGQAHAINKGLARSTGDIVGWLNSDDLLLPGSLVSIAKAFRRRPDLAVVSGFRKIIDRQGRVVRNWMRDPPTAHYLRHYCCVPQETVYWRRQVTEEIGPLDEEMQFALDYEYWLRMLAAGYRFTQLPRFLGAYRSHERSKTSTRQDAYYRDIMRLFERYRMGRNEEAVQQQLGADWPMRLALLEDLGKWRMSGSARLIYGFSRLLERPWFARRAVSLYRRYRCQRPRRTYAQPRWLALSRAFRQQLLGAPMADRQDPYLLRSNPLNRPRLPWKEVPTFSDDMPADTLFVGDNWWWIEESSDQVYRWATSDAEIVVLKPSGLRRRLELHLESGPSLGWKPFELEIVDDEDRPIERRPVAVKERVQLFLPLAVGPRARCFRLRVRSQGLAASAEDPRVLNFRMTWLGWRENDLLYDLPRTAGQVAEVALARPDVVPDSSIDRLEQLRDLRSMPTDGLFVGKGWFAPETSGHGTFRRATCGCELVVTEPGHGRRSLAITVAPSLAGSEQPYRLELLRENGSRLISEPCRGRQRVLFEIPFNGHRIEVLKMSLRPAAETAACGAAWRVFRVLGVDWGEWRSAI